MLRKIYVLISMFIVFALLTGCQNNNPYGTIPVSGTIKLDGQPIGGVHVTFLPVSAGKMEAFGMTIQDGSFVLSTGGAKFGNGAQPGEYHVVFSKTDIEDKYKIDKKDDVSALPFLAPIIHLIPEKYNNLSTSGIAPVKVEKNKKNIFGFDLSTK